MAETTMEEEDFEESNSEAVDVLFDTAITLRELANLFDKLGEKL